MIVPLRGGSKANVLDDQIWALGNTGAPNNRGNFWWSSGTSAPNRLRATPRPKIGHKIVISPDGAPNCSSHHPDSSHIGFHGSKTNGNMAVAAQNAPAQFRRESLKQPILGHNSPKNQYFWLDFDPGDRGTKDTYIITSLELELKCGTEVLKTTKITLNRRYLSLRFLANFKTVSRTSPRFFNVFS